MSTTLKELLETPIAGNASDDCGLLIELDNFAADSRNSIEDRAKAIKHKVEKVMGCEEPLDGIDLVQEFVKDTHRVFGETTKDYFPHIEAELPIVEG